MPSSPQEWLDWYGQIGETIGHSETVEQAANAATLAAVATVPGATWASITHGSGDAFATIASSSPPALAADRLQAELGEGPALDVIGEQTIVHSGDIRADERWVRFGPRVVTDVGVRSVLSVRMKLEPDDLNAGLNVYADAADVLSQNSVMVAAMLAVHASAVVSAVAHGEQARHLQKALESNREIGVAMGVLMNKYRITRDQSFALLRMASQNSNRKLRDVAADVADTGTINVGQIRSPRR